MWHDRACLLLVQLLPERDITWKPVAAWAASSCCFSLTFCCSRACSKCACEVTCAERALPHLTHHDTSHDGRLATDGNKR